MATGLHSCATMTSAYLVTRDLAGRVAHALLPVEPVEVALRDCVLYYAKLFMCPTNLPAGRHGMAA